MIIWHIFEHDLLVHEIVEGHAAAAATASSATRRAASAASASTTAEAATKDSNIVEGAHVLVLFVVTVSAARLVEVLAEDVLAMAARRDAIVNDEGKDDLEARVVTEVDVLTGSIEGVMSLDTLTHAGTIGASVTGNTRGADVVRVILRGAGDLIFPRKRRQRLLILKEIDALLDGSRTLLSDQPDAVSLSHLVAFESGHLVLQGRDQGLGIGSRLILHFPDLSVEGAHMITRSITSFHKFLFCDYNYYK